MANRVCIYYRIPHLSRVILAAVQPDRSTGFVQDINRLIRQVPVCKITVRQFDRRFQRFFCYLYMMVPFIASAQALQNFQGRLCIRRIHTDRLEPPLQRRIFFHAFTVIFQRGGSDYVKFPSGQRRFDNICDIHGAVAAVHQHLQLIHKQNDSGAMLDSFNNIPQAFFQFAPILGPCNHIT